MKIFLELDEEFHFTLDPTKKPIGNLPGRLDGLRTSWMQATPAIAFVNPPYERGLVFAWVAKCLKEMRLGHCQTAIFLVPLRNSDYFKLLRKHGAEFRLCEKRLKFGDADGSAAAVTGAPFDSVVAIFHA